MTDPLHPALQALDPQLRAHALAHSKPLHLPVGIQVFGAGDPCQGLPLVIRGCVRVQMTGASGSEIVLYRIVDHDLCTLSVGCLVAERAYRAEALVEEPTEARVLPHDLFEELMGASAAFRRYILTSYGSRLDTLMLLVEEVAFGRMDARLAQCLLARSRDGEVVATHQELAVELGTAREVVSRLLKDLERAGVLRLQRGRIAILTPQRLIETASGTSR